METSKDLFLPTSFPVVSGENILPNDGWIESFLDGANTAIEDFENGEIIDLSGAIQGFVIDPADTPFQSGYGETLVSIKFHGLSPTIRNLISGDMRKFLEELEEELNEEGV
tara:strand:- start:868 stop:1200 length:333 start_codon:yes stop_codon:yes gene_type:complete